MADMVGRLTGRAGVCLGTLGPGATNLVTAVADAYLDRAPLVALTGQGNLERMHKKSHQYLDIVAMMAPITKWNARVNAPDIVPEVVRKAFKVAESEKPGATHLELPEDVMAAEVHDLVPLPRHRYRGRAHVHGQGCPGRRGRPLARHRRPALPRLRAGRLR
jgi:acetolactate synthase-1/2/3 large subunit